MSRDFEFVSAKVTSTKTYPYTMVQSKSFKTKLDKHIYSSMQSANTPGVAAKHFLKDLVRHYNGTTRFPISNNTPIQFTIKEVGGKEKVFSYKGTYENQSGENIFGRYYSKHEYKVKALKKDFLGTPKNKKASPPKPRKTKTPSPKNKSPSKQKTIEKDIKRYRQAVKHCQQCEKAGGLAKTERRLAKLIRRKSRRS